MTEYDYSPEAYDRYLRTQQRIAQWVDNTEAHRPEFGQDAHYLVDPSVPQIPPGHRPTRSMQEVPQYHRRQSSSSTSSSSEEHSNNNLPRSMHVPGLHPMYQHQQPPVATDPATVRPPRRHTSSSRHHDHRSHRSAIQTYVVSPPPNTPAQQYPYAYNINAGGLVSPGPYGYTAKGSTPYATSPTGAYSYYSANQGSYPFPQPSYSQHPPPKSSPGSYSIYAPQNGAQPAPYMMGQQQPQPYIAAAYPPMIYPIATAAGSNGAPVYPAQAQQHPGMPQQAVNPRPLFYQRIFGQSKKGKSKGSSRRSN